MKAGEVVHIPLSARSYNTIRNTASLIGTQYERKYSVHLNREAKCYSITRER